jgi:RNA polymerase sigma factor (sigma-70 family)
MADWLSLEGMPISIPVVESPAPAARDAQAVAAVLGGDTLSYRELVERYQGLVYAVAWSRLGNATLAEDAAQEAFIRAYRSLPLLGNGAKFSAWVTAIARNTAHSLGLKQRKELERCARWALEQPTSEPPAVGAEETCSPELLRQTLAELSDVHRESLVLYYFEGKHAAEAAAALGISEAALRMRLMRARAALRERLEVRLGKSLERLQPSPSLVPGVMGAIVSTSTAKAGASAGIGTTFLAALGKVLPLKIALGFVPLVVVLGFAGTWSARQKTQSQLRNLRDPDGFRAQALAKTYQAMSGRINFWPAAMITTILGGMWAAMKILGYRVYGEIFAAYFLIRLAQRARLLRINRGKYIRNELIGLVLIIGISLVTAFDGDWLTDGSGLISAIVMAGLVLQMLALEGAAPPPRLDNDLFLREQLGLLQGSGESAGEGRGEERLSSAEMFAFARFLGERFLVDDFRRGRRGDELLLRAELECRHSRWLSVVGFVWPRLRWKQATWLGLKADGTVSIQVIVYGAQKARESAAQESRDIEARQRRVASAVEAAWRSFRAGDITQAERAIGQVPEAEIFIAPAPPVLTRQGALKVVIIGIVLFVVLLADAIMLRGIIQAVKQG